MNTPQVGSKEQQGNKIAPLSNFLTPTALAYIKKKSYLCTFNPNITICNSNS